MSILASMATKGLTRTCENCERNVAFAKSMLVMFDIKCFSDFWPILYLKTIVPYTVARCTFSWPQNFADCLSLAVDNSLAN